MKRIGLAVMGAMLLGAVTAGAQGVRYGVGAGLLLPVGDYHSLDNAGWIAGADVSIGSLPARWRSAPKAATAGRANDGAPAASQIIRPRSPGECSTSSTHSGGRPIGFARTCSG